LGILSEIAIFLKKSYSSHFRSKIPPLTKDFNKSSFDVEDWKEIDKYER